MADPLARLESRLEGEPDAFLSALLVLLALVILAVAWKGPRVLKLAVAAWVIFP